jgi:membrane protease YdiL (CAAX protease family)
VAFAIGLPISIVALGFGLASISLTEYFGLVLTYATLGAAMVFGLVCVAGLSWLVVAGIIRRRGLAPDRYRGGSVLAQLGVVELAANLVIAPVLVIAVNLDLKRLTRPDIGIISLVMTDGLLLAAYVAFVQRPRALAGVRLFPGLRSVAQLGLGGGIGVLAAVASGVVALLLQSIAEQLGWNLAGDQAVTALLRDLPIAWSVLGAVIIAPVAEELFFRGLVFNAWEREYGTARAVVGSAALFALVHVVGGTVLAVIQVLFLGLLLAYVYMRARSLAVTIGMHAAFNLVSVLALFFLPGT